MSSRCPFLARLSEMPRLTEERYADGLGALYEGTDPNTVAARIFDQSGDMPNSAGLSQLFTTWGQFLDHDLSLVPEDEDADTLTSVMGTSIHRSEAIEGTGVDTPLQFGNSITWQIDASMVYGSNAARVEDVRAFEGGRLKMSEDPDSPYDLLPENTDETVMAGGAGVFLAGDVRANENPNLLSMHTLFARDHNYWADKIAEAHPDWDDQQIFDAAREIVEYQVQKITYEEWLPHLIGGVLPDDIAHDPGANGEVSLEFATAAFRFGHTLVSGKIPLKDEDGGDAGSVGLLDAFFDPNLVKEMGIDELLRGQTSEHAQELDTKVIDDLNFFLATPDGAQGFSLVALNLMRAADHGIGSYVDVRAQLLGDIDPATLDPADFGLITGDAELQAQLANVYETVHDVDLWVGGLAEDAIDGTQMGPLFTHILSEQFARTAAADATWGDLPDVDPAILAEVRDSSFSDLILRNTLIDTMQDDPFLAADRDLTMTEIVTGTWQDDDLDLAALDIAGRVETGGGDDTVTITGGTRLAKGLETGAGDDTVLQTSGDISGRLDTGAGNDTVLMGGTAEADHIDTRGGDDTARLMEDAEAGALRTGSGNDTVELGDTARADHVGLGSGDDSVTLSGRAEVEFIDGGSGIDTLAIEGRPHRIEWDGDDPASGSGRIVWLDEAGRETGDKTYFRGMEAVPCFTPGTRILTAAGHRPVESLAPGDLVWTWDDGLQPLRWVGRATVPAAGDLAPIRFAEGALGNSRRLLVSPQHRMVLDGPLLELITGSAEALAPAVQLVNDTTVRRVPGGTVTYIHLLFDRHQIVMAEGVPSESFHPGGRTFGAMGEAARAELLRLFPELAGTEGYGPSARPTLKAHETRLATTGGCPVLR